MQLYPQSKITKQVHTTGKKLDQQKHPETKSASCLQHQFRSMSCRQDKITSPGAQYLATLALLWPLFSSSSPHLAEQMTLAAAGLCVVAVLGSAVTLGSWTTGLEAPCRLAASSFHPSESPAGLGPSRCAGSPRQRSLEVLLGRTVGLSHGELTCVATETG